MAFPTNKNITLVGSKHLNLDISSYWLCWILKGWHRLNHGILLSLTQPTPQVTFLNFLQTLQSSRQIPRLFFLTPPKPLVTILNSLQTLQSSWQICHDRLPDQARLGLSPLKLASKVMYIGQTLQPHFPQAQLEITNLYLQIRSGKCRHWCVISHTSRLSYPHPIILSWKYSFFTQE